MRKADLPDGMKDCTLCGEIKPFSEFSTLKQGRFGLRPACKPCSSAQSRAYATKNSEKVAARKAEHRSRNKEEISAYNRAYAEKNADRLREKRIAHYHATKDERRELKASANKTYRERNKETISARRKAVMAADAEKRERNRVRAAQWYSENKDRASQHMRSRYQERRDEIIARIRNYKNANPDKVRMLGRVKSHRRRGRLREAGGNFTREDVERLMKLQRGKCACCGKSLKDGYHIDHRIPVVAGGDNSRHNIELLCPPCNQSKAAKLPHEFAQERGRLI